MSTRLVDLPSGADIPGNLPSGSVQLNYAGTELGFGQRGTGWSTGFSDMDARGHLSGSMGRVGLRSFDGGQSALYWDPQDSGGNLHQFGTLDCGGQDIAQGCFGGHVSDGGSALSALILGDRAQVKVGEFVLNTVTGEQSVEGVGFEPDLILFLGPGRRGVTSGQIGFGRDGTGCQADYGTADEFGAVDKDGNQWACSARSYFFGGNTALGGCTDYCQRQSRFRTDACFHHIGSGACFGGPTFDNTGEFVSMDADGFTVNLTAAAAAGNGALMRVVYMAIKVDAGHGSVKVGNGVQGDASLACGFAPDVLLFRSAATSTEANSESACTVSAGLADADAQRSLWVSAASAHVHFGDVPADSSDYRTDAAIDLPSGHASAALTGTGADLTWTGAGAALFGWVAFQIDDDLPTVPVADVGDGSGFCHTGTLIGTVTPNVDAGDGFHAWFQHYLEPGGWASSVYEDMGAVGGYDPIDLLTAITQSRDPTLRALNPGDVLHYRVVVAREASPGVPNLGCVVVSDEDVFTVASCDHGLTGRTERIELPYIPGPITS